MIKDVYKKYKNIIKIAYIVCFAIVCMLCYTHAQPTKEERIFIFVSGQKYLKEDIKTELENIGKEYGILKVDSFGYDESDSSFSQAFATKGYYSTDLFILSKDVFESYKVTGTFSPLSTIISSLSEDVILDDSGNVIAVAVNDKFYIAIASKCDKSTDLLYQYINYLMLNGDDLFE